MSQPNGVVKKWNAGNGRTSPPNPINIFLKDFLSNAVKNTGPTSNNKPFFPSFLNKNKRSRDSSRTQEDIHDQDDDDDDDDDDDKANNKAIEYGKKVVPYTQQTNSDDECDTLISNKKRQRLIIEESPSKRAVPTSSTFSDSSNSREGTEIDITSPGHSNTNMLDNLLFGTGSSFASKQLLTLNNASNDTKTLNSNFVKNFCDTIFRYVRHINNKTLDEKKYFEDFQSILKVDELLPKECFNDDISPLKSLEELSVNLLHNLALIDTEHHRKNCIEGVVTMLVKFRQEISIREHEFDVSEITKTIEFKNNNEGLYDATARLSKPEKIFTEKVEQFEMLLIDQASGNQKKASLKQYLDYYETVITEAFNKIEQHLANVHNRFVQARDTLDDTKAELREVDNAIKKYIDEKKNATSQSTTGAGIGDNSDMAIMFEMFNSVDPVVRNMVTKREVISSEVKACKTHYNELEHEFTVLSKMNEIIKVLGNFACEKMESLQHQFNGDRDENLELFKQACLKKAQNLGLLYHKTMYWYDLKIEDTQKDLIKRASDLERMETLYDEDERSEDKRRAKESVNELQKDITKYETIKTDVMIKNDSLWDLLEKKLVSPIYDMIKKSFEDSIETTKETILSAIEMHAITSIGGGGYHQADDASHMFSVNNHYEASPGLMKSPGISNDIRTITASANANVSRDHYEELMRSGQFSDSKGYSNNNHDKAEFKDNCCLM